MHLRALIVSLLCLLVWGCGAPSSSGRVTAENYNRIEGGMTPDQVRAILGKPDTEQSVKGLRFGTTTTAWEYASGDYRIFVFFRAGMVFQKDEQGLGIGMKSYGE
jgi:SmpA/OmlA family protein